MFILLNVWLIWEAFQKYGSMWRCVRVDGNAGLWVLGAALFDGTQKEAEAGEWLPVFTPCAGLVVTCNRLLNTNCEIHSLLHTDFIIIWKLCGCTNSWEFCSSDIKKYINSYFWACTYLHCLIPRSNPKTAWTFLHFCKYSAPQVWLRVGSSVGETQVQTHQHYELSELHYSLHFLYYSCHSTSHFVT